MAVPFGICPRSSEGVGNAWWHEFIRRSALEKESLAIFSLFSSCMGVGSPFGRCCGSCPGSAGSVVRPPLASLAFQTGFFCAIGTLGCECKRDTEPSCPHGENTTGEDREAVKPNGGLAAFPSVGLPAFSAVPIGIEKDNFCGAGAEMTSSSRFASSAVDTEKAGAMLPPTSWSPSGSFSILFPVHEKEDGAGGARESTATDKLGEYGSWSSAVRAPPAAAPPLTASAVDEGGLHACIAPLIGISAEDDI